MSDANESMADTLARPEGQHLLDLVEEVRGLMQTDADAVAWHSCGNRSFVHYGSLPSDAVRSTFR
jgi:hypothetical protein